MPRSGPMVGLLPTFFDASGAPLGSAHDLEPERRLAGLPLLADDNADRIVRWVGASPLRFRGVVSEGDVFLHQTVAGESATDFRESLRGGRVAIVIDEES